jgi:RimJ/RimL family protein N-acetyltransferase
MATDDHARKPLFEPLGRGAVAAAAAPPHAVIETARLVLRPPVVSDAPTIAELADDRRVAEMLVGMPHPYRIADALAWIDEPVADGGQKHVIAVRGHGGDTVVGVATLDFRRGARLPTLGAWIGAPFQGRGYATEAAHAVIDFAFLHQGHQRLSFTCRVTNTGGRRLIEKCGFQPVAQELCPSAYFRAVVPVDRFTLDRSTWDGLRRWGPLRVTAGAVADGG